MEAIENASVYNGSGNVSISGFPMKPETILFTYVLPVIIFVGLWGNVVSFIVFLDKELRHISSSIYILAVLCSDTGMLINQMITWLEPLGYNPWFVQGTCQLFVFSGFVFGFLSEWYVVCITVENYVTLRHPTKIKILCTMQRALIVTSCLAFVSVSSYFIFLFTTVTWNGSCFDKMDVKTKQIFFYIDNIATLLLPTIILFVLLISIILQVIKSIKSKRRMSLSKNQKKKSSIPQVRVAKMLFVLSITSFVLSTPDHILKLYFFMSDINFANMSGLQATTSVVLMFLYYTRFAIKFFILIAFSKNFRKKILTKFRCTKKNYDIVRNQETIIVHDIGVSAPPDT